MMAYPRHTMLRVAPEVWVTMLAQIPQAAELPLVRAWADRGLPLVVRRQGRGDGPGVIGVGLPLPPSLGKLRLALTIPQGAAIAASPPPLLSQVAVAAPAAWQDAVTDLIACDAQMRCFGSLAWQYLTGLAYLSPTSDLDLVCDVGDALAADARAAGIAQVALRAPMTIDGELVGAGGNAVQWREWLSGSREVLVKTRSDGGLMARETVFA